MKLIKLTESQFSSLLEAAVGNAPDFNGGDIKEYPSSEVSTTANVTNANGEIEYGKPTTTDKISDTLSIQNFWANGCRSSRPQ